MIEPMKKVSIVLLNKEKEEALKALRRIGLVHLEKIEGAGEKLTAFKEYSNNAMLTESILGEIKLPKQKKGSAPSLSNEKVIELCSEVVQKSERRKQLMEEISADTTELDRFALWGSVCIEDLDFLKEKGIALKLYEINAEKYNLVDPDIQTILVNNDKKTVRFLIVNGGEGRPEKLLPEAFEVPYPRISTKLLEEEIRRDEKEIDEIQKFYVENAKYVPAIAAFKKALESDIEFENVNCGMGCEKNGTENDLAWLSGYVPSADLEDFKRCCSANGWAVAFADPEDEDVEVPTKLKNNKFVSLIYPLTDFLGTVPGYHEFDISGWFLLFFTVFFAMIFGDGGYGLLVAALTIILMLKNAFTGKKVPAALGLILLVSLATVVWGAVTCTWFGIPTDMLPEWLKNLSIPYISGAYEDTKWYVPWNSDPSVYLTKDQNLQIFCFSLALVQLCVAHIKAGIRNLTDGKGLKVLGDLGSFMQLVGMFWIVLAMVVNGQVFPMLGNIGSIPVGKIEVTLIAVGFAMSFIFANYEGSIGASVLESCKNIISVLLGVVNVFSDIVSYIRLWAVGLAGAAISNTVNTLAGPILGHAILFLAAIVLLGFGHGLNMILNVLSVIVHGVRLNTLEFCTHIGMSWSGVKYQPFADSKN
ncbi:V/A-type H+-transporting ATPase subunit I [Treponema bryantii]|uniref:V/A-type H+-transporting ATPase subunit I n=1 Tax=Treponema bryantii TaxID=163 RepID=A0A1H9J272_9SPIR|nr:ATPase [Treponema bryantii]SEQ80944.1 V/A-type H+-transporting ATPase subunit I [Treponema bryantii]